MSIPGSRSASARATPPLSDPELLSRLATGQLGALGELYDRYQEPLRCFIARATRDAHDVDDLLHAAFLAAAQSAHRYDGRANARPWLVGIAATLLRRRHQSFTRLVRVLGSLKDSLAPPADPHPHLHARTDLERALAQLSEPKRITLLMAEVEGLSCDEIAQALSIPIGTVWTRLHAARRDLRQALSCGETP